MYHFQKKKAAPKEGLGVVAMLCTLSIV